MYKSILLLIFIFPFCLQAQTDFANNPQQSLEILQSGLQNTEDHKSNKLTEEEILVQIRDAKTKGDVKRSEYLLSELDKLTGNISVKSTDYNEIPKTINEVINQPIAEGDYNLTIINGSDNNWSIATSTDRFTGRIYVVATKYCNSGIGDTMKVYTSTNKGIAWIYLSRIYHPYEMKFRSDELDIEAMNNGTTSYIFIVSGWSLTGTDYSEIYRINSSGGEFFVSYLMTGPSSLSVKNILPRITSDNSKYDTGSYIYIMYTQDSVLGVNNHTLKTKFTLISNPFDVTPNLLHRNNHNNGTYASYAVVAPDTTKLFNDIAFSDSLGNDQIITLSYFEKVTEVSPQFRNCLYLTYSRNYGATHPPYRPIIIDLKEKFHVHIASTGFDYFGKQFLMINYIRQYTPSLSDSYYYNSTNNGATWSNHPVDIYYDTAVYADVIAIPRSENKFHFAYSTKANNVNGKAYVSNFNNGSLTAPFRLNNTYCYVDKTPIRAGYRYGTNDSCFTIVQGLPNSTNAYTGCSGFFIGIQNNETPLSFNLVQNYPNPFNPVTKISYSLPKSGLASLKVYDILGKEIATLVNEVKSAGKYSIDFNASNLTSGVYFYKLETNGFNEVKKMLLLK